MEKINENNDEKEKIDNNVNTNDSESIYGKEQQENNVEKEKIKLNKKPALNKNNSKGNKPKLSITDFNVSQTLGRGAYAKVVKGDHKGKSYAIKVIDKKFIEKYEKIHEVHTEKQILSSISHPNIIKMHFTFQDSKNLYFVLDYCSNKDFSDFLKTRVILSKELAQYYTAEIVYVLDYLRKNGISHRDLKPENIMLDEKMKIKIVSIILNNIILFKTNIKQIDFATATKKGYIFDRKKNKFVIIEDFEQEQENQEDIVYSLVGTAEYVSPEALKSRDQKVDHFTKDLWALGCMVYRFFEGMTPFRERSEKETFDKILNQEELQFSNRTPSVAQDLIVKLLDKTPEKRIGFEDFDDLKNHPFFKGIYFDKMDTIIPPDESVIQVLTNPLILKKSNSMAKLNIINSKLKDMKIEEDEEMEENMVNYKKRPNNNNNHSKTHFKRGNERCVKSYPNNKSIEDEDDEYGGLGGDKSIKSKKNEGIKHKNTFSESNTYSAEYEEIKYNLRRSTLKTRKTKVDKSLKKYSENLKEVLVLECKKIFLNYNKYSLLQLLLIKKVPGCIGIVEL